MNNDLKYKQPSKKTEIVWLGKKRDNKKNYYQAMTKKQLITEYVIDDLEHLFKPYGCEK
jgi:hypothetical protein